MKEVLNIEVNNHHRAYYDALTTAIIFEKNLNNIDFLKIKTVEDLINLEQNINKFQSIRKLCRSFNLCCIST